MLLNRFICKYIHTHTIKELKKKKNRENTVRIWISHARWDILGDHGPALFFSNPLKALVSILSIYCHSGNSLALMDIALTTPKIKSPLRANHSAADLLISSSPPSLRPQLTRSQSTHSRNSSASSVNSAVHPHSPNPSSLRHTIPTPIYHHDQEADIGEGLSASYTHPQYNHLPAGLCHSEPFLAPPLDSPHSQSGSCTTASLSDEEEVSSRTSSSDVLGAGAMFEIDTDITELRDNNKLSNLSPDVLAKFRQWMVGFCVVNFDLEIGQGMSIYPRFLKESHHDH